MPVTDSQGESRPRRLLRLSLAAAALLTASLAGACDSTPQNASGPYTTGPASAGGTGRYYMGRELAHFMSYEGAGWLERPEREIEERSDIVVENLPLAPDSVVADIGAGSGYYSRRIAQRLPKGKVIAVDIQPEMLALLRDSAAAENIANIETVLSTEQSLNLPPESIDLALMVDVYHELAQPLEVMREVRTALRPGGKLVLIEFRAEDPAVPIIPVHKMTAKQARLELAAAGFEFVDNLNVLPIQHFLVFARDRADPQ